MKELLSNKYNRPINKLFFIGIGGSSLSGLAEIALSQGFSVEGSDMVSSVYTDKLISMGIKVHIGHSADNIDATNDLVVYSAAIHENNPERQKALALEIPQIERSDYLGQLSRVFDKTIGVAGTHGKTTTSSMIANLLTHAGLDPSISIGGRIAEMGHNAHLGKGDYFVIESCEFVDSFLKTEHFIGIITNIEEDHLDYFKGGLTQIKESFHKFGAILPENGLMIAYGDSQDVLDTVKGLRAKVVTYGINPGNDFTARNITYNQYGHPSFDAYKGDHLFGHFSLIIPGEHNVLNALSCIICADFIGIDVKVIEETLAKFSGAKRRFEFKGQVNGINVYEDYAHHPTEIKVVVNSCINHRHNRLWVVFQPHTYSRTYFLLENFIDAFEGADFVILNDIYSDREDNDWNIYSEDIAKKIKDKYGIPTIVLSEFETIVKFICDNVANDDLVLVAGSQTINKVAYMLVDSLKEKYKN